MEVAERALVVHTVFGDQPNFDPEANFQMPWTCSKFKKLAA
jgi:hypothetical protein